MAGLVVSIVSFVDRAKACLEAENGANAAAYSLLMALVSVAVIGGAALVKGLGG
jgi:Flp pilus assembly pilin Flp